jgi:hypothetical protein
MRDDFVALLYVAWFVLLLDLLCCRRYVLPLVVDPNCLGGLVETVTRDVINDVLLTSQEFLTELSGALPIIRLSRFDQKVKVRLGFIKVVKVVILK